MGTARDRLPPEADLLHATPAGGGEPDEPVVGRPVARADRDAVLRLLDRAFPDASEPPSAAHWDWLYGRGDPGRAYAVAATGDRLVSQYASVPMRLQIGRRVVPALLTVDAATDPDFAGRGLYTALARSVYARTASWAPVAYAFPNPASAGIFYGRLGWVELRPFPLLVRPLAGLRRVERLRHRSDERAEIVPLGSFAAWGDRFWQQLAPALGTAVVRDAAYLAWRFQRAPVAYDGHVALADGAPVAFAVTRQATVRGKPVTWLMELLALPAHDEEAALVLGHAIGVAAAAGSVALLAIATGRHPQRAVLRREGFLPLPPRLTGSLSFGVRVNGPAVDPARVLDLDAWHLSAADLDFI